MHHIVATAEQEHWFPRLHAKLAAADALTIVDSTSGEVEELSDSVTKLSAMCRTGVQTPTIEVEELRHLPSNLRELHLGGFRVPRLPEDFGDLFPNLESLRLNDLGLTHIPDSIGVHCRQLRVLAFRGNPITGLPDTFSNLDRVRYLTVAESSGIRTFPMVITEMGRIKFLSLSDTPIDTIPPEIARLTRLKNLRMLNVPRLRSIPTELEDLPNLEDVWATRLSATSPLDVTSRGVLSRLETRGVARFLSQ